MTDELRDDNVITTEEENDMIIRNATAGDLPRIMEIYAYAREYMAANGNPNQWGGTNWPPEDLIRSDISQGKSYVCEDDGRVVGVFFFDQGKDIEPTYEDIEGGSWAYDEPYGVIHRIASDGSVKGVGAFCFNWALGRCSYLRADTHPDNRPMQNLLGKLGFEKRGVIHVTEDDNPRFAYEFMRDAMFPQECRKAFEAEYQHKGRS